MSFDVRLIPGDDASPKVRRKLRVFEDGTPEEYCKWRIDFEGLTSVVTYARNDAQVSIINTLLRGKARDTFVRKWTEYTNTNPPAANTDARAQNRHAELALQHALNDVALMAFGMSGAVAAQKDYMRKYVLLDTEWYTVREFARRLEELNKYIPYFP